MSKLKENFVEHFKHDKKATIVFIILNTITFLVMIRCVFEKRFESVFVAILAQILFLIPPFIEKNLKVELPTALEILAFSFVFCAEVLGEIEHYYVKYAFWDTALHTLNGFMFAAFGFCLVDLLNKNKKIKFQMSPIFLCLVAFCFSMTIGVLWEFFEFFMDSVFGTDMQKDYLISTINSVSAKTPGNVDNISVKIDNIIKTIIYSASGDTSTINGGYLDVGIIDTIKDLFVNFIGAVVFSIVGFFYVKRRGKGKIARQFIPVVKSNK